jgi:regulatory protein
LRRVLENKLRRASLHNLQFRDDEVLQGQLRTVIESIVTKHKKTGIINDVAFAQMKTETWRRAGRSARAIRQRLTHKGIAATGIDKALHHQEDESENAELKAALVFARRRKLGPFFKGTADQDKKRKDFANFARAGFSFDIAKQILGKNEGDFDGDEF